ncbi:Dual specificity protein phosphatase 21 [Nowakowskiella sp. JEL0407]|nr:Dual specificity protein phosphatase 21 [Nowakowskiella sp. JEL0407]
MKKNITVDVNYSRKNTAQQFHLLNETPVHIANGIYVGNISAASNELELKKHGITHILNITDLGFDAEYFRFPHVLNSSTDQPTVPDQSDCPMYDFSNYPLIKYHTIVIPDSPSEPVYPYFTIANAFINSCVSKRGRCLIASQSNVSRSATFLLAYLVDYHKMLLDDAFSMMTNIQPQLKPNHGFAVQLINLHRSVHGLKKTIGITGYEDFESKCCTPTTPVSTGRKGFIKSHVKQPSLTMVSRSSSMDIPCSSRGSQSQDSWLDCAGESVPSNGFCTPVISRQRSVSLFHGPSYKSKSVFMDTMSSGMDCEQNLRRKSLPKVVFYNKHHEKSGNNVSNYKTGHDTMTKIYTDPRALENELNYKRNWVGSGEVYGTEKIDPTAWEKFKTFKEQFILKTKRGISPSPTKRNRW